MQVSIDPRGRVRPRTGFIVIVVCASLLSLWIRTGVPAYIIAGARYDDQLFIRLARFILIGQWLGPFDNTTLVKGVGYPIFAALAFAMGVPLKMAETVLYIATSIAGASLVVRLSRSHLIGAVLFLALVLNPVLWGNELARVIREGIYVSLTLLSVLSAVVLIVAEARSRVALLGASACTGSIWA